MADNLMAKTNEESKTISKQLREENIEYKDYVEKQATRIIGVISDVAMGDFSVRAKHERNDDLGALVIGLNMMIEKLEKQHTELEKKVEERTKELVNSKRMIERQNIKLKKLDRLKSDFINITSHELRTPLTSIKGYVQMLLNRVLGDISEEQQKGLEVVLRNANHLDNLVQDLLDVSQLQSGTMRFTPEQTDMGKMLDEVVETMQSSANLKEIKIDVNIKDNLPELIIDKECIKKVIMHLVSNSIKFSPNGSIVNVRAGKEQGNILFEVQDLGKGIPKDKQKKVFETFYQVDSGMDRAFGGVGLGLTISQGIVVAHGGKIWTEGNYNKGSIFRFTLPAKPVQNIEGRFEDVDTFRLKNNEKTQKIIEKNIRGI